MKDELEVKAKVMEQYDKFSSLLEAAEKHLLGLVPPNYVTINISEGEEVPELIGLTKIGSNWKLSYSESLDAGWEPVSGLPTRTRARVIQFLPQLRSAVLQEAENTINLLKTASEAMETFLKDSSNAKD
jgi:hypothetical protein